MKKPIRRFIVLPLVVSASFLFKVAEAIVGEKYTYRKKDVQRKNREELLDFLKNYHREQGITFFSEGDAVEYLRGLIEGME